VVMSIYVNPSQFGPREDFGRYPRPFREDCRLARAAGVDAVFAPRTLYAADESTRVVERGCSMGRCGPSRPGHFDGVCTVVAKLFLIVQPHTAVFGEKDAQQCDVIARMVRDLCMPVRVVRAPTVRDGRGVAMSSRNRYLSPEEYATAVEFAAALQEEARGGGGPRAAEGRLRRRLGRMKGLRVDYVEAAGGRLCAAVRVGKTRLIDNRRLERRGTA
jgi:pantoate--beta-alanine ligase